MTWHDALHRNLCVYELVTTVVFMLATGVTKPLIPLVSYNSSGLV